MPEPRAKTGDGYPLAEAWKLPAVAVVKVVERLLVKDGAWFTVRVKAWVASVPTPLVA
jgi:hypothetical protein